MRVYMQYFQTPGVAEAALERDIRSSIRRLTFTASGEFPEEAQGFACIPAGSDILSNTIDPPTLLSWITEADIDYYVGEFSRSGFRGGLNWHRNLNRNAGLQVLFYGMPIRQPSLFVAGVHDAVLRFPNSKARIEAFPKTLPANCGIHILDGAGHWVQRERANQVNELLIKFLKSL